MPSDFTDFAALWPSKSGRAHRGSLDKRANAADLIAKLEAGWSILLLEHDARGNDRAPSHKLVLAPPMERNASHGHRSDAPSQNVGARRSQQAMDMQRPGPPDEEYFR